MVASGGIVNLARLAGAPIVPIVCATSRRRILNTWDRFNLALPFGRGVFFGASRSRSRPISTLTGLEQARLLVETRMNEMAREADRRVGHAAATQSTDQFSPARPDEHEPTGRGPVAPITSRS